MILIKVGSNQGSSTKLDSKVKIILGVIQAIGIVLSVVILMIIGIKYMLGSVEEKSEYKKNMIPYLIGAIMTFSITTLPNLIYNLSQNVVNSI